MTSQARPTTRKLNFDFHHNERPSAAFESNEPRAIVPSAITSWTNRQKKERKCKYVSSPPSHRTQLIYIKSAFPGAKTAFSIGNITSSICVFLQSKISFFGKMRTWLRSDSILVELLRNIFDLFTPNNKKGVYGRILLQSKKKTVPHLRSSIPMPKIVVYFENHKAIGFL